MILQDEESLYVACFSNTCTGGLKKLCAQEVANYRQKKNHGR